MLPYSGHLAATVLASLAGTDGFSLAGCFPRARVRQQAQGFTPEELAARSHWTLEELHNPPSRYDVQAFHQAQTAQAKSKKQSRAQRKNKR